MSLQEGSEEEITRPRRGRSTRLAEPFDSIGIPGPNGERLFRRDEVESGLKAGRDTFIKLAVAGMPVYGGSVTKTGLVFSSDLFEAIRQTGIHAKVKATVEAHRRRTARAR